jgi:uncharacterized membrane protein (UPF0136 family)
MVLSWTYFLILQTVVLATFYFKRNDKDDFAMSKLFPTKVHFLFVNLCVFLTCYFYNAERQLFCIPVPWAATVIILFCVSFLALPFIRQQTKFLNLVATVCGIGFFIAVYILLFAREEYLIFVAINIPIILILHFILRFVKRKFQTNVFDALYFYPIIILTPFILVFQLWVLLKSLKTKTQKRFFVATPVLTLIVCLMLTFQIKNIINRISIATDKEKELKEIVASPINYFLTELILGAHWKYHTELCLYDGWRPPFHDPVLVVANKVLFPFSHFYQGTDLPNANRLYKVIYPNKPTIFDCKCASNEKLFDH